MNPNEQRLQELEAEIEQKKAEIASIKAMEQQVKADEMASRDYEFEVDGKTEGYSFTGDGLSNKAIQRMRENQGITAQPTEEQMALLSGIGLQGNRGADGSMVTEKQVAEPMSMQEAIASLVMKSKRNDDAYKDKGVIGDAARAVGMSRVDFVMSPEFQEVYGSKYDEEAKPMEITIQGDDSNVLDAEAEKANDAIFDKDIDIDERTDAESAKQVDMGNPDQDRRMAMEDDIEPRSEGFKADNSGNMSVDEKDDYWKTQEGYDKAIEMYGIKPAFVPDEPTLVFNPTTQKYEKIRDEDKEDYVDLSRPNISSDLKALLG